MKNVPVKLSISVWKFAWSGAESVSRSQPNSQGVTQGQRKIVTSTNARLSAKLPRTSCVQPTDELATGIEATSASPTISSAVDLPSTASGTTTAAKSTNSTGAAQTASVPPTSAQGRAPIARIWATSACTAAQNKSSASSTNGNVKSAAGSAAGVHRQSRIARPGIGHNAANA